MTLARIVPHFCLRTGLGHAIRVTPAGIFIRAGRLGMQIDPRRPFAPGRFRAFPEIDPPFDPRYRRLLERQIESAVPLVPPMAVLHSSDPFDPEYRRRAARKANP